LHLRLIAKRLAHRRGPFVARGNLLKVVMDQWRNALRDAQIEKATRELGTLVVWPPRRLTRQNLDKQSFLEAGSRSGCAGRAQSDEWLRGAGRSLQELDAAPLGYTKAAL